jgi:hypothetical protein
MLFDTNKNKGRAGMAMAIAYFGANGYTVNIPLNDTQDYDLIVDDGKEILKISVKSTGSLTPYGIYTVSLKSCGGTNGKEYARVGRGSSDYLFVLCGNKDMYLIPKQIYKEQATLNLREKMKEYKIEI